MLEFIGCGDLHFDGKLRKYLPNLNSLIIDEVNRVLAYAKRNGVKLIVFYGDICDVPAMSDEARRLLLALLMDNHNFSFIFVLGNHDTENAEVHSMQMFVDMIKFGMMSHVRVIEKPTTLFKKTDTPLRLLPWPSLDTQADCLNVIHMEVAGSVFDGGRAVDSKHKVPKSHVCVAGHLHTPQRVGSVDFSGTLYQTNFGEKPKKFFHHVTWNSADEKPVIKRVPHAAAFKLVNLVIENQNDIDSIEDNPLTLYKVFVHMDIALEADTFADKPNVVKTNSFKTKTELETLLSNEINLDQEFEMASVLSLDTNLKDWLSNAKVDDDLKNKAYKKFKQISARIGSNVNTKESK